MFDERTEVRIRVLLKLPQDQTFSGHFHSSSYLRDTSDPSFEKGMLDKEQLQCLLSTSKASILAFGTKKEDLGNAAALSSFCQ